MVKLSKSHTKFIKSLQLKKYRQSEQAFLVEGEKSVLEVLESDFEILEIICTEYFAERQDLGDIPTYLSGDLSTLGNFKSNNQALAVVRMKSNEPFEYRGGLVLALDAINDPGNLGTILRTADWYGVSGIIASRNTCEFYNPKVISASKGSFTRIPFHYQELRDFVPRMGIPVLAADLTGENVHEFSFPRDVCLLLGNEAHGISPDLEGLIKNRIHIPRFGNAESLNVGIAAAVIMDNYRRTC